MTVLCHWQKGRMEKKKKVDQAIKNTKIKISEK